MHSYHPWRELRALTHIVVRWVHLPHGVWGLTDRIWLDARLGQAERRSTLAHELEHIRCGHTGCQPPAVEAQVEHHAARRPIPNVHHVADALVWAGGDLHQAADELWVDEPTLRARLDPVHLHPAEKEILRRRATDSHLEQAMVEASGLSSWRCWQALNRLLDKPIAWEHTPATCRPLRGRRRPASGP